jgi:hypothetical protein
MIDSEAAAKAAASLSDDDLLLRCLITGAATMVARYPHHAIVRVEGGNYTMPIEQDGTVLRRPDGLRDVLLIAYLMVVA